MEGIHGKLMNLENEWDHRILATVKEGPSDYIRTDEVAAALKKDEKTQSPRFVRASSRNDTCQGILELSGYWIYVMVL